MGSMTDLRLYQGFFEGIFNSLSVVDYLRRSSLI